MFTTTLWIIYVLDCLFLIGIILIQPGEAGDLAAAFGGSSQTAFGARGSATVLQKATTGAAILFMVLSVVLVAATNWKQRGIMDRSLPTATKEAPVEQKSAAPAPAQAPTQGDTAPAPAPEPPAPAK